MPEPFLFNLGIFKNVDTMVRAVSYTSGIGILIRNYKLPFPCIYAFIIGTMTVFCIFSSNEQRPQAMHKFITLLSIKPKTRHGLST